MLRLVVLSDKEKGNTEADPETRSHCINSMEELGSGTRHTVLPWSAGSSCFLGLWDITLKGVHFSPPVFLH